MSPLTCHDVDARLVDYLDRELLPEQRQEVEAHLTGCDRCVLAISHYERTIALARAAYRTAEQNLLE